MFDWVICSGGELNGSGGYLPMIFSATKWQ